MSKKEITRIIALGPRIRCPNKEYQLNNVDSLNRYQFNYYVRKINLSIA